MTTQGKEGDGKDTRREREKQGDGKSGYEWVVGREE